jgi:hypothetical protein
MATTVALVSHLHRSFLEESQQGLLASRTLYPPQYSCSKPGCPRTKNGLLLKKEEVRQVVLYTLDSGALPAYSIHLSCQACHINYHHNFSVESGQRIYYDGIPEIIQAGEHQFVERRVVVLWVTLMLVSW